MTKGEKVNILGAMPEIKVAISLIAAAFDEAEITNFIRLGYTIKDFHYELTVLKYKKSDIHFNKKSKRKPINK